MANIWDILNNILEKCDEFVEGKVENVFGALNAWLDEQVARTDTKFDDNSKKIILLGIRDKILDILPLDEYPKD
jgi:hypothetical protein